MDNDNIYTHVYTLTKEEAAVIERIRARKQEEARHAASVYNALEKALALQGAMIAHPTIQYSSDAFLQYVWEGESIKDGETMFAVVTRIITAADDAVHHYLETK